MQINFIIFFTRTNYKMFFLISIVTFVLTGCSNNNFVDLTSAPLNKHWIGDFKSYSLNNGVINARPNSEGNGFLYTKHDFKNFILEFDFRLTPGANNGIGIRTPITGDPAFDGLEIQILDNSAPKYSRLHPWQYHGSVYGLVPAKKGFLKPVGDWNRQTIKVNGTKIKVILNNELILNSDLNKFKTKNTPDNREHPGIYRTSGRIALCGHGSPLDFKNIYISKITKK